MELVVLVQYGKPEMPTLHDAILSRNAGIESFYIDEQISIYYSGEVYIRKAVNENSLDFWIGEVKGSSDGDSYNYNLSSLPEDFPIERLWGAFLRVRKISGGVFFYRDPSGQVPAFYHDTSHSLLFFTSLSLIKSIVRFSPDYDRVLASVLNPVRFDTLTCLKNVCELVPGQELSVQFNGQQLKAQRWRPSNFTPKGPVGQRNLFEEQINDDLKKSLCRATGGFSNPLIELSGGLDSSLLLSFIAKSASRPVCLHYSNKRDPHGLDTANARLMAKVTGALLIEVDNSEIMPSFDDLVEDTLMPNPSLFAFNNRTRKKAQEVTEAYQCASLLSGTGGDACFFSRQGWFVGADFIRDYGPLSLSRLQIAALVNRSSLDVPLLTYRLLKYGLFKREWNGGAHNLFPKKHLYDIKLPTRSSLKDSSHPWLIDAEGIPCGKIAQIEDIICAQSLSCGSQLWSDLAPSKPWLSQPVMEAFLKVESYRLAAPYQDRTLIRNSFLDMIPEAICENLSKGSAGGFYKGIFMRHRGQMIREVSHGILIERWCLPQATISELYSPQTAYNMTALMFALRLFAAEVWIRNVEYG